VRRGRGRKKSEKGKGKKKGRGRGRKKSEKREPIINFLACEIPDAKIDWSLC
jgi:hypothetical protein